MVAPPKASTAMGTVEPRNAFESYIAPPNTEAKNAHFISNEELDKRFRSHGATESKLPAMREAYDDKVNSIMESYDGGKLIKKYGICYPSKKPEAGDFDFQDRAQFMLDYYDLTKQAPVNSPPGYELHLNAVAIPGMYSGMPPGPLHSWEWAFRVRPADIRPGEERFSVLEGSCWRLEVHGREVMRFLIPMRPMSAEYMRPAPFQPRALEA
ncbi:hypothetical protein BJ138DRAFT_1161052 [Hygrophoropsis aurantiaca]|uniref:Uncharacterized protein n=1 Tax=Hygrophoropsis aurantiaca TaxID=72124 RepID=A0ACB8A1K3_9AGAM|nr:hypothetical protein BJ138DRAFT_1161052 [Hygrophoropsis aurantiaca]